MKNKIRHSDDKRNIFVSLALDLEFKKLLRFPNHVSRFGQGLA